MLIAKDHSKSKSHTLGCSIARIEAHCKEPLSKDKSIRVVKKLGASF
jgi:hypothetical protein